MPCGGWPGDGQGMGYFLIPLIKMVHFGVLLTLFCSQLAFDVDELNIEGLTSEMGAHLPPPANPLPLTTVYRPTFVGHEYSYAEPAS